MTINKNKWNDFKAFKYRIYPNKEVNILNDQRERKTTNSY